MLITCVALSWRCTNEEPRILELEPNASITTPITVTIIVSLIWSFMRYTAPTVLTEQRRKTGCLCVWYTVCMMHSMCAISDNDTQYVWYTVFMIRSVHDTQHAWYSACMMHSMDDTQYVWYTVWMIHTVCLIHSMYYTHVWYTMYDTPMHVSQYVWYMYIMYDSKNVW